MSSPDSRAATRRLLKLHVPNLATIASAIVLVAAASWFVAAAATIPTVVSGKQTLVAVEPLLRSLQMGYVIAGSTLEVNGRRFPQPLVDRGGMEMADAAVIARFLHLDLARKNGVLVFSTPAAPTNADSAPPPLADLEAVRDELLASLNAHRQSMGRAPLRIDRVTQQAAQYQADDMARAAEMRHEDARGRTPMQRYAAMGGAAEWYAENVGWYGLDVSGRSELWKAVSKLDAQMMAERPPEDGHRKNILAEQYDAVGIGLSVGPNGVYLAEDFSGP